VPVGSNIPVVPVTISERDHYRSELGILPTDVAIGVFSLGGAGKLYGYIADSMQAMLKTKMPCFWIFIGVTDEEYAKRFPKLKNIPHYCTGYLSADKVSRWMQSVDLLAAPFDDGVSTRRTSVIAAMSHGIPTITTAGHLTDEDFYEKSPLLISPLDAAQFAEMVVEASKDLKRLRESRGEIREFFKAHFRWKSIVEGLISPSAVPDNLKKSA
jgi:glycosyltransferase involved in cell wall biosynthesis